MTTITVKQETWSKLAMLRITKKKKTFDDVINMLLKKEATK